MASAVYQTKLTADTSQHDAALGRSAKQVYKYKQECDKTDKSVQSLFRSVGKFAGALSAAKIVGDTFKNMLKQNQDAADNFGSIMQSCKSISDEFAYSLSTMDFSNMYNGLGNLISRAKEYYNELDKLNTLQINLTGANAKLDAELANARRRYREGDKSAAEDIKRIGEQQLANMRAEQAQIKKVLELDVRKATSNSQSAGNHTVDYETNWDMEDIKQLTSDMKKLKGQIAAAKKEYESLKAKAGEYNDDNIVWYDVAEAEAKYKALERLYDRYSDGDNLKELNDQYARYYRIQQQHDETQARNLRYLKEDAKTDPKTKPTTKVKAEIELPEGSIAALEKQISELKQKYNLATSDEGENGRNALLEKIKEAEKELAKMKLDPSDILPEGSMAKLEEKLKDLKLKWRLATTDDERDMLQADIDEVQDEINRMNGVEIKVEIHPGPGSEGAIRAEIARIQRMIENTGDANLIIQYKIDIENLQAELDALAAKTKTPSEVLKEQAEAIKEKWDEASDAVAGSFDVMGAAAKAFANTDDAVTNQMLSNTATLMGQIGALAEQVLKMIGVNIADAMASGVASAAKIGWPQNIGAIASIVAQIMAIAGTISSYANIGKHANGGIIQGNSRVGDMNIARVNAGEMILNGTQQARLFRLLNGSLDIQGSNGVGGNVVFHISGDQLVGVLSNYDRTRNRVR